MSLIAVHNHVALFHISIAPSTFIASFTLSLFFFFTYLVISGFVAPLRFPSFNPLARLFRRRSAPAPVEVEPVALPQIDWRGRKALPALPQQERPILQLANYEYNSPQPYAPWDPPRRSSLRSLFSSSRRTSNISNKTYAPRDRSEHLSGANIEITELELQLDDTTEDDNLGPAQARSKPSGRLARRLPRATDPAANVATLLRPLPVGALGVRSVVASHQRRSSPRRGGGGGAKGGDDGRERQRNVFSLRRWLQPTSLEKARKR